MGTITTKIVFDRRKKASANQQGTLEIKVYYDYKTKYVNTGIKLFPNLWRGNRVCNRVQAKELNNSLQNQVSRILIAINEMDFNDESFTLEKLEKKAIIGAQGDFLKFMEDGILNDNNKEITKKHSLGVLNALKDFGLIVSFGDINQKNIQLWDEFDKSRCGSINSVANYHKVLKK